MKSDGIIVELLDSLLNGSTDISRSNVFTCISFCKRKYVYPGPNAAAVVVSKHDMLPFHLPNCDDVIMLPHVSNMPLQ
jgi:hypothetical protein